MSEYTPGPWTLEPSPKGGFNVRDPDKNVPGICRTYARFGEPEDTANARLIAASPDLLEAAKAVLESYSHMCLEGDIAVIEQLFAAVEKVETVIAPIDQQGEPPEDDWDNEDYVRGWQDAKRDSVDPRSKTPCPGCARGEEPVMLDEDGTKCSISGRPGRLGHGVDDRFWFCDDHLEATDGE